MAEETYDGSVSFSIVSGNAAVLTGGEIRWLKTGSGAEFWVYVTDAARKANTSAKYLGNYDNYIRLKVDGITKGVNESDPVRIKTADGITAGTGTGGATGWVHQSKYEEKSSEHIFVAAKNTAYTIDVISAGNGDVTVTKSATIKFNIPLFVNPAGTVYQVEKAYANASGVGVKEVTVYANVGGEIKEFI